MNRHHDTVVIFVILLLSIAAFAAWMIRLDPTVILIWAVAATLALVGAGVVIVILVRRNDDG